LSNYKAIIEQFMAMTAKGLLAWHTIADLGYDYVGQQGANNLDGFRIMLAQDEVSLWTGPICLIRWRDQALAAPLHARVKGLLQAQADLEETLAP